VPVTWEFTLDILTVTDRYYPALSGLRRPLVLTPVLTTGRPRQNRRNRRGAARRRARGCRRAAGGAGRSAWPPAVRAGPAGLGRARLGRRRLWRPPRPDDDPRRASRSPRPAPHNSCRRRGSTRRPVQSRPGRGQRDAHAFACWRWLASLARHRSRSASGSDTSQAARVSSWSSAGASRARRSNPAAAKSRYKVGRVGWRRPVSYAPIAPCAPGRPARPGSSPPGREHQRSTPRPLRPTLVGPPHQYISNRI
jgi:hypothetical protein